MKERSGNRLGNAVYHTLAAAGILIAAAMLGVTAYTAAVNGQPLHAAGWAVLSAAGCLLSTTPGREVLKAARNWRGR